ncbi:putative two-component response transcriptional regulator (OmpR family) [Candidatus Terasakiella magnetica]|nr:putative two-component response transcriptional regulator (OmpR family) [Candidatus Terasakiella magnetica]
MSAPVKLLLVIPEPMLCQTMAEHLSQNGTMAVSQADSAAAALASDSGFELALVDEDQELCRALRTQGIAARVILLSAANGIAPTGIDAIWPKPLRLAGLAARLAEVMARRSDTETVRVGGWSLDPERRVLQSPTAPAIRLTDKEAAILSRLAQAEGAVVGRDALLAEVWGYAAGLSTHTLETHIYRLRRKLGQDGACLVTDGGGYRLAVTL